MSDFTVDENVLLAHIRQLLFSYARTHLTADYENFTVGAVEQLQATFTPVSITDPSSLILPTDPWDKLTRLYGLKSLKSYDETPQTMAEATSCIKQVLKKPGTLKTRSILFDNQYDDGLEKHETFPQLLTRRAMKETPVPGSNAKLKKLPTSYSAMLDTHSIERIPVQDIEMEPMNRDALLDTIWKLKEKEREGVSQFLKSTFALSRPGLTYTNQYLDPEKLRDVPDMPIPSSWEEPFIPIFRKSDLPGAGRRPEDPYPSKMQNISDLPSALLPPVEIVDDFDLQKEIMVVVDGWETIRTSSPLSSAGSVRSTDDEVDQLFLESPDTTPPPMKLLKDAKMDEVQIARTKKIGGCRDPVKLVGHDKSFSQFLLPLLPKTDKSPTGLPSSPEPSLSMIGQASTLAPPSMLDADGDLDLQLAKMYENLPIKHPKDLILREQLDAGSKSMMEVPILPPPNEHKLNNLWLPTNFKQLLAPVKPKGQPRSISPDPVHMFLKMPRGISALRVELSWIPFTLDEKLPSHAKILGVEQLLDKDDHIRGISLTQMTKEVEVLLQGIAMTAEPKSDTLRILKMDTEDLLLTTDDDIYHYDLIMSREERRRLAGINSRTEEDAAGVSEDEQPGLPSLASAAEENIHPSGIGDYIEEEGEWEYSGDKENFAMDDVRWTTGRTNDDWDGIENDTMDDIIHSPLRPAKRPLAEVGFDEVDDEDKENFLASSGSVSKRLRDDSGLGFLPEDLLDLPPDGDFIPHQNSVLLGHHSPGSQRYSQDPLSQYAAHVGDHEFDALSFNSQNPLHYPPLSPNSGQPMPARPSEVRPNPQENLMDNVLLCDLATQSLGIADFAKLRAKKLKAPPPKPVKPLAPPPVQPSCPPDVPQETIDRNTLQLPDPWISPSQSHRYLASLEVIQKQRLVRGLRSRECAVDLVERDHLDGVDIILDPHTAAIFINLLALPLQCETLTERISQQSWRYSRILVVFEAYSPSQSHKAVEHQGISVYSPPVLKAIKKLRRDMSLAEAFETMSSKCSVKLAFAGGVEEAAMFTRHFGNLAECQDESGGVIWDDRLWLENDVAQDEEALAAIDGMNRFAAFLILCQIEIEDLMNLVPEERLKRFGSFVGNDRMIALNAVLQRRMEEFAESDPMEVLSSAARIPSLFMSNPPFQAQLQDTLSGLNRVFQKELDSGCSIFETGKTTSTAFMSRFEGCSNLFDSFPIGDSESPSPHHFICSDKDRALILVAFCQTSLSNSNSLESDVTPAFLVARDSKQDMNVRLAAILGSIGGVAFVATIVLVFIYQYRRKRKSRLFFGKPLASVSISGPLTAPDTQLSTDEPVDWDQRVPPRRKDSLASRTSRTSRTGDEKRRDRKSVIPFSPKSFTSRKSIIQTPITSPVRSPQSVSESITSASFPKRPPRPLTYLASGPDPPNFRSRSTSNLRSPSSTNIRSPSPSSFRSPSLSNSFRISVESSKSFSNELSQSLSGAKDPNSDQSCRRNIFSPRIEEIALIWGKDIVNPKSTLGLTEQSAFELEELAWKITFSWREIYQVTSTDSDSFAEL
ncbi:hypothetical protein C8J56DRAFT_1158241 [Mycena floridula]|nr:hypothetical protein C8J56DRAFT_1158241 [Mycena floridula]